MRILVLCTGNSARSQIAEAFLRSFDDRLEVYSAGTVPSLFVNPHTIQVMREVGVEIGDTRPKSVEMFLEQPFDFVITVCADADRNCPVFSGRVGRRVHIGFDDPARTTGNPEEVAAVFRRVREEIRASLRQFYECEIKPLIAP